MKLAILLLCHKGPEQINMFLKALNHKDITIFIHVDRKAHMDLTNINTENVIVLPDYLRVNVQWAKISQVSATLNLLKYAVEYGDYDYFWLCSGQDYPIKNVNDILTFFRNDVSKNYLNLFDSLNFNLGHCNNYDKRNQIVFKEWMISRKFIVRLMKRLYIEFTGGYDKTWPIFQRKDCPDMKFFFGSQWWCLTKVTVTWMLHYLNKHSEYYEFFSTCLCPDESFFHTLVMNSPYAGEQEDYLHYIDWSEGKNSPKILLSEDYGRINKSNKLMARKFDLEADDNILQILSENNLSANEIIVKK